MVEQIPGDQDQPVEYPINGIIDLHSFAPQDVQELIPEYIHACLERRIYQIKIIHGKGTGALRETVHALLRKNDSVASFRLDSESPSSWGATLVELKKAAKCH